MFLLGRLIICLEFPILIIYDTGDITHPTVKGCDVKNNKYESLKCCRVICKQGAIIIEIRH